MSERTITIVISGHSSYIPEHHMEDHLKDIDRQIKRERERGYEYTR